MQTLILTPSVCTDFQNYLYLEERSTATIQSYIRTVRHFSIFTGQMPVTKQIVLEYKQHLAENYCTATVNTMIAAINSLFSFLKLPELKVKTMKCQKTVYCPEKKELTQKEYKRLCQTAQAQQRPRLSLLLQTICATGIRISELRYITVEAAKKGEAIVRCKGKTRSVFLVRDLCKKILRYAKTEKITDGMIFVSRTGKPLDRSNIWRELKSLCADAHVEPQKVFPHNLRHLFARTFYAMEKDIAKLADILGHSSINTTRIYIISTGAEHRKKLESMHLIL